MMRNQTEAILALKEMSAAKKKVPSTIKVQPHVSWPKFGDKSEMGTQEVKEFFEKFEELTSLANDGEGMSAHEKLIALSNSLMVCRMCVETFFLDP